MSSLASTSTLTLPSGVSLELALEEPIQSSSDGVNKLAVLLHPWSWLGGCMYDPVLEVLIQPLQLRGYHVILYNSRGVGRSSGWPSFTGSREVKDLQDVVQWGLDNVANVQHVLLVGYSHGSLISSQHPPLPNIPTSHILLSYPLGPRAFLTCFRSGAHDRALRTLVQNSRADMLLLFGDTDEFTGIDSYERFAERLKEEGGGEDGRVQVACVKGASHFWRQETSEEMLRIIGRWLDRS